MSAIADLAPVCVTPETGSAPGHPIVLYFHHVRPAARHYTELTPSGFALALELVSRRLDFLTPTELAAALRGRLTDRPSALITLDDGCADQIEQALPLLDRYDAKAVFFVPTAPTRAMAVHPAQRFMTPADWQELANLGHVVAAHGRRHVDLTSLPEPLRVEEMLGSLTDVDAWVPQPGGLGPLFAFPYGQAVEVPAGVRGRYPDLTAFGTVKAPPLAWAAARHLVRRTYLPTGAREGWAGLVDGWVRGWYQ